MRTPKMILFDYGHTLCHEPNFDFVRGNRAFYQYIKKNPRNLSPEEINSYAEELFGKLGSVRKLGYELNERQFQRFLCEYLGLELSISYEKAEKVLWTAAAPGEAMPCAEKMLEYINWHGIRSGVISNMSWSGEALTDRLNRLLPKNKFEFVITSSEYMFRKPAPEIFELAIRKTGLKPSEIWYCGNDIVKDAEGASAAGLFPVWYDCQTVIDPLKKFNEKHKPSCKHLRINYWLELIDIFEKEISKLTRTKYKINPPKNGFIFIELFIPKSSQTPAPTVQTPLLIHACHLLNFHSLL
jgi:putative hydrolase of the HAD superfamily